MATINLEGQCKVLSTCSLCLEVYDDVVRKPKYLPCCHYFCIICIREKIPFNTSNNTITCYQCNKVCPVPNGTVETFPENITAIALSQVIKKNKNNKCWCLTCKSIAKPSCNQKSHNTADYMKEADKCDSLLDVVGSNFSQAALSRQEVQKQLLTDRDQLKVKLKTVEDQIEENKLHQQMLEEEVKRCQEMKKLSSANKAVKSLIDDLQESLKKAKQEVELAKQFLNKIMAQAEVKGATKIIRSKVEPISEVKMVENTSAVVAVGQMVVTKSTSTLATVIGNSQKATFYRIQYVDRSTLEEVRPADVIINNLACKEDGPPPTMDSDVNFISTADGNVYKGFYKGSVEHILYHLQLFDDRQTTVTAKRSDFELDGESISYER